MTNIWFISDTHFYHSNILNFTDKNGQKVREFHDVFHMNEYMIDRWNGSIKPQDKVYHLGDVYFGSQQQAEEILSRLNGHKRLIIGNHDTVYGKGNPLQKYFEKMYVMKKWPQENVILSHIPLHQDQLYAVHAQKHLINLHGHIHQNDSPPGPYINLCVEKWDYIPVHLDEIRKLVDKLR